MRIYVNGSLKGESNYQNEILARPVTRNFCFIGRSNSSSGGFANADFDDIKIFKRDLNETEIKIQYEMF